MPDSATDGRITERSATPAQIARHVVYFIEAVGTGMVKIGVTRKLPTRYADLRTSSAVPLTLLGEMPGTREDEARLHRLFAGDRSHGEWFRMSPDVLAYIERHAQKSAQSIPLPRRRPRAKIAPPPASKHTRWITPQQLIARGMTIKDLPPLSIDDKIEPFPD